MDLYFQSWIKFATFNDKAKRSEYWVFVITNGILYFLLSILNPEISLVFSLFTIIPHIAVSVRRLHDINLSGWWALLFVPTALPMLIVGLIDSKNENENIVDIPLAKAVINHSKELVQEVKPTINNYIQKHNKIDEIVIKDNLKVEDINEDEIYEQVLHEIEKDDKVKSTWAKALSQSDGDDKKAQSLYIKLRVDFLIEEKKKIIENQKREYEELEKKRVEHERLEQEKVENERREREKLASNYAEKQLDFFLTKYSILNKRKISDTCYILQLSNSPVEIEIVFDNFEWKQIN